MNDCNGMMGESMTAIESVAAHFEHGTIVS